MTISIRLDAAVENSLRDYVARNGGGLSDFLREAIEDKLAKSKPSAHEVGQQLFGRFASGVPQRSQQRKQMLREKLHAKHRR